VLTVEFTVGRALSRPERGPAFRHSEAFSFQIATDTRRDRPLLERHRRQWRPGERVRLVQGPLGVSWQITPRVLTEALAAGGDEAKARLRTMMTMRKIDVAAIAAARAAKADPVGGAA